MAMAEKDEDLNTNQEPDEQEEAQEPELQEEAGSSTDEPAEEESSDEVVVTIGDEEPPAEEEEEPAKAAPWVKELRKSQQETNRRNKELERELAALKAAQQPAAQQPQALSAKPTLQDHDYDAEAYDKALEKWYEDKRAHDERERKKQEEGAKAQTAYQAKLARYNTGKTELKVSDFADAEAEVLQSLSPHQQGLIIDKAKNSTLVVYAIGKNPKKLAELAAIQDPIDFALAMRELEAQMKVTPKKTAPLPETNVRGNARVAGVVGDSTLSRLEAEADRTGDRTKVAKYRKELMQKAKARA